MNGIVLTLRTLYEGESRLARELLAAADRHRAEHEVFHVARDLAAWSREHAHHLAEALTHRAAAPGTPPRTTAPPPSVPPGLLLLHDLRALHLAAAENSLHWEMLAQTAQTAQAARESDLLALASACHPQTLRQMRWTNTMIKNVAPQILTSL